MIIKGYVFGSRIKQKANQLACFCFKLQKSINESQNYKYLQKYRKSISSQKYSKGMSFFSKLSSFFGFSSSSNETQSTSNPLSSNASSQIRPSSSRPAVQTNVAVPPNPSTKVFINLQLICVPDIKRVQVQPSMTGQELKEYIHKNISKELGVNDMSLYYEGTKITKYKKLSQLVVVVGTELKIIQSKVDIAEISAIVADANGIDPITDQVGTAKMSCGHHIGKDSMTALIRSLISSNKYEIRCPNSDEDEQPCLALWDYSICKKIGVFTQTERSEFENGLNNNWMKEFAKTCPQCKCAVSKYKLETNRVKCPNCKFGDFCYLCLNKWKGTNGQFCGNEQCKFLRDFIENSPWNKKFWLRDRKDPTQRKQYLTPQYRSCVHCYAIIEHAESCKHMQCKSCKKSFCWVCLSVPQNGNYPCGKFNEYCDRVAQRQRFGGANL